MNIRLKILAIFILTLIIGVGGGYLYYSLITQRIVIGKSESLMYEYHPEPVVIPGVNLSNVNVKKVRRNTKDYDEMVVPGAGRKLPSEGTVGLRRIQLPQRNYRIDQRWRRRSRRWRHDGLRRRRTQRWWRRIGRIQLRRHNDGRNISFDGTTL